jgi:hypothetical protein
MQKMTKKRYETMPEIRQDQEHQTGCSACHNKTESAEMEKNGYVNCKIYAGKISKIIIGCARHRCDDCPPSAIVEKMVQSPIVKKQKTLGEI